MGYRTVRYENKRKLKRENHLKLMLLLICIIILIGGLYIVDIYFRMVTDQPNIKMVNYKFENNTYKFLFLNEYSVLISRDEIYSILNNINHEIKTGISYIKETFYKIYNRF